MKNLLIGPWDLLVDLLVKFSRFYEPSLLFRKSLARHRGDSGYSFTLTAQRLDAASGAQPRKMCFYTYGIALNLYGRWPAPTL